MSWRAGPLLALALVAFALPLNSARAQPQSTAVALLEQLAVKGRAPKTGYERAAFGPAWSDVDRNGCDTRNDILNRDLTHREWRDRTHNCVVIAGTLADPYTGESLPFVKADAGEVQIDHVVALSDAWQTGALAWNESRRLLFANDPLELLAVDGTNNERKGDGDAATWLPPARGYRCAYVARQVAVKNKWGLWVTQAEHDAIARVLAECPGQGVPHSADRVPVPPVELPAPTTGSGGAAAVYYENCSAARAAGAAPLRVADPGYRPGLDRDHDGVACE